MLDNTVARRANAMIWRYRGRAGEYMWEKEQERLKRYKDRPWELQSRESQGDPMIVLFFICMGLLAGIFLFSLFQ